MIGTNCTCSLDLTYVHLFPYLCQFFLGFHKFFLMKASLCREGRKKQNVRCVRFNIDGEARVILVAIRDIPKGERLYYDYNAYQTEYPTQHFV